VLRTNKRIKEKKIHKEELKVEVDGVLAQVKAQIIITKEVKLARKLLQKKMDASTKALSMLQGAFETAKRIAPSFPAT
jgi:hypothetical protein